MLYVYCFGVIILCISQQTLLTTYREKKPVDRFDKARSVECMHLPIVAVNHRR